MEESLLGLLGDNSSLLDLHLLDVLAQTSLDSSNDVGLVSLERVEVSAPSDFELCHLRVLLHEHRYIAHHVLFLATFLVLSADLPSFNRLRNSFGFLISFGWVEKCVPLFCGETNYYYINK
jgi:hypothetical protein